LNDLSKIRSELSGKAVEQCPSLEDVQIEKCCWTSMVLVTGKSTYEFAKADTVSITDSQKIQQLKNAGFSLNDLLFSLNGDNNGGGDDNVTPDPEIDLEREGDMRFTAVVDYDSIPCKELRKCGYDKDGGTVGIGVIDFGYKDPHYVFIKQIIENRLRRDCTIEVVDYNLVQSSGFASIYSLCCQIQRGIEEKIPILNISLGYYSASGGPNLMLKEHILRAADEGIYIICSAGNQGSNNDVDQHWPSNFSQDRDKVIAVGSLFTEESIANYSNFGLAVNGYTKGRYIVDAQAFNSPDFPYIYNSIRSQSYPLSENKFPIRGTSFAAGYIARHLALNIESGMTQVGPQDYVQDLINRGILIDNL